MKTMKSFLDLEFSDAFMFAATMEDEELCREILSRILEIPVKKVKVHKESTCRVFLNTRGKNTKDVPVELISLLRFVENGTIWKDTPEDALLQKLHERISYLKHSRRLEERYMLFGEMLDDERREGRKEGRLEGYKEERGHMMALIQAMCADGREKQLSRISSEPKFLDEMLKHYHIVSCQETV